MVDKSTARALVYGALAMLGLILVIAIYAVATKGSVQAELDAQLERLQVKERQLRDESALRRKALGEAHDAAQALANKEKEVESVREQREQYQRQADEHRKRVASLDSEAHMLRRRVSTQDDQARMEELEGMDEETLRRELQEEGDKFFSESQGLGHESPSDGQSADDLKLEMESAAQFKKQFLDTKGKLGAADGERALEDLEEVGEQNEVYLDELERDAKKHVDQWRAKERPAAMKKLAHEMDLHAEALRKRYAEKRLKKDSDSLEGVYNRSQGFKNDPVALSAGDMAKQVEEDEERVDRELKHAEDDRAGSAAEKLEHDIEEDEVHVGQLEQQVKDSTMSPEDKARELALLKELEEELERDEQEGENIGRGLERKQIRHDAVRMAENVNELVHQPGVAKLKHAGAVKDDVEKALRKEGALLETLKEGNDTDKEEELGEALGDDAEDLERDSSKLYDEAEAGDFDNLDEKLLDEHIAKELLGAGQETKHDADGVDQADRERAVRSAGHRIDKDAQHVGSGAKKFGADTLKRDAHALDEEAEALGRAVGEQAWDEEVALTDKLYNDAKKVETEAREMEKRVAAEKDMDPKERDADLQALKDIEAQAQQEERAAESIRADVRNKAKIKVQHLEQERNVAAKVADTHASA